jgi:predicted permease
MPEGALPAYADIGMDARAFGFGLGLALVTGLLSGIAPALRTSASSASTELRGDGRGVSTSGRRFGLQQALVVAEIAIALPLLVGAGLMVRSLREQLATDPGFRAEGAIAARISLPERDYSPPARTRFATALVERVRALPGVVAVTLGSEAPLRPHWNASILFLEERPEERIRYYRHPVFPGWFETLGIRMLSGREFETSDDEDAPPVAVVTQAMASRSWPGRDPLGQRLQIANEWVSVVGVVEDVRYRDLTTSLMDPGEDPDVFLSFAQLPPANFDIVVRLQNADAGVAQLIQREVAAIDASIPIHEVQPLPAVLAAQTALSRFGSFLLALFGSLALALAAVGLYGVMAFVVGTRRREIAIRLAVGAEPRSALGMVLRQGMGLVVVGCIAGISGALAASRLLESLLFGVTARDPLTFVMVSLVLLAVSLAANFIPAYRATRIDPQTALKSS